MEHRAGWDATFSAPKSVSLTALVGGDDRVREAHRESVRVALDEMEKYAQARIGGNASGADDGRMGGGQVRARQQPSGGWLRRAAVAHARGDLQCDGDGRGQNAGVAAAGTLQDAAVRDGGLPFGAGGAVAAAGLRDRARRAWAAGDQGLHAEYLEASSPRRQQIEQRLEEQGRRGAGAAQIAAHQTRDAKQPFSIEEVRAQHQQLAAEHGISRSG
jgi:hypothetical protein